MENAKIRCPTWGKKLQKTLREESLRELFEFFIEFQLKLYQNDNF